MIYAISSMVVTSLIHEKISEISKATRSTLFLLTLFIDSLWECLSTHRTAISKRSTDQFDLANYSNNYKLRTSAKLQKIWFFQRQKHMKTSSPWEFVLWGLMKYLFEKFLNSISKFCFDSEWSRSNRSKSMMKCVREIWKIWFALDSRSMIEEWEIASREAVMSTFFVQRSITNKQLDI